MKILGVLTFVLGVAALALCALLTFKSIPTNEANLAISERGRTPIDLIRHQRDNVSKGKTLRLVSGLGGVALLVGGVVLVRRRVKK